MSEIPTAGGAPESSVPAARWIELAERMSVCGRGLRDGLTRQARRRQLSRPEFSVLWACREAPPAGFSQSQLAATLGISAAQVSGLVERLRRSGLLASRRAEADRRRQHWCLTPTGRARLEAILLDLAGWAGWLDHGLGSDHSGNLGRLLDQLAGMLRTQFAQGASAGPPRRGQDPHTARRDAGRKGAA